MVDSNLFRRWRKRRHLRVGKRAERLAERFLKRQGLATIERNFSRKYGEIDLVMRDGPVLVFVEVRYRGGKAWTDGLGSIDLAKQRRLIKTAASFLQSNPKLSSGASRFDVVSVSKTNYRNRIDWVTDAFTS